MIGINLDTSTSKSGNAEAYKNWASSNDQISGMVSANIAVTAAAS